MVLLHEVFTRLRAAGLKAPPGAQTSLSGGTAAGQSCTLQSMRRCCLTLTLCRPSCMYHHHNTCMCQTLGGSLACAPARIRVCRGIHKVCTAPVQAALHVQSMWAHDCENACEDLKLLLTVPPVLRRPDSSLTYILHNSLVSSRCWSSSSAGRPASILWQPMAVENCWRARYAPTQEDLDVFAVVRWLQHFRHHVVHLILEVDQCTMKELKNFAQSVTLARCAVRLQEFNLEIKHWQICSYNADAMIRSQQCDGTPTSSPAGVLRLRGYAAAGWPVREWQRLTHGGGRRALAHAEGI